MGNNDNGIDGKQTNTTPCTRRSFLSAGAAAAAGLWLGGCGRGANDEGAGSVPPDKPKEIDPTDPAAGPNGKRDLTFFITADTHFGYKGIEATNRKQIDAMNSLPGTPLPKALGGVVGEPTGVLVAGDLTDYGHPEQWKQFVEHYGLNGKDGLLKYPTQECSGNHDVYADNDKPVLAGIRKRHGSLSRGWIWQGVCFVSIDAGPSDNGYAWLARQLAKLGTHYPVVLMLHYSIVGPYSDIWSEKEKADLAGVLKGHNIVAIFHGHYHMSERYKWEGFDVYNVGSPRHMCHTFAAARITDNEFSIASRWWDPAPGRWYWSHRKTITTADKKVIGTSV